MFLELPSTFLMQALKLAKCFLSSNEFSGKNVSGAVSGAICLELSVVLYAGAHASNGGLEETDRKDCSQL